MTNIQQSRGASPSPLPGADALALSEPDFPKRQDWALIARSRQAEWRAARAFEPAPLPQGREIFSIDTPPPTASGELHLGHAHSYIRLDARARAARLSGRSCYFPLGIDDNGLPTERLLEARLGRDWRQADPQAGERELARIASEYEGQLSALGLSHSAESLYRTSDASSQALAQGRFLELARRGEIALISSACHWDINAACSISHAEIETRLIKASILDLRCALIGEAGEPLGSLSARIERAETLASALAIELSDRDPRWEALNGARALSPLFFRALPLRASADLEPGEARLLCSYQRESDMEAIDRHGLEPLESFGARGEFLELICGSGAGELPSANPREAQAALAALRGLKREGARAWMTQALAKSGALLAQESATIQAQFWEKGASELLIRRLPHWSARWSDKTKGAILQMAQRIRWSPQWGGEALERWALGMSRPWRLSRQRPHGIPIPFWLPIGRDGSPDWGAPILADAQSLPLDPEASAPPGRSEGERGRPGGFMAPGDKLDTWFCSSLTPRIAKRGALAAGWALSGPISLRSHAREIIRSWTFYTLWQSALDGEEPPFEEMSASGWILASDGAKMEKGRGNGISLAQALERWDPDALRYWACSSKTGSDAAIDEAKIKRGRHCAAKAWSALRLIHLCPGGAEAPSRWEELKTASDPADRAFAEELLGEARRIMERYAQGDLLEAQNGWESLLWDRYCQGWMEGAKERMKSGDEPALGFAKAALKAIALLMSPIMPHCAEALWERLRDASDERFASLQDASGLL